MQITDPRAMRALAHPLRIDLIEVLGVLGPTTAAVCAKRLGTSQASCSFHLRQLAKYGFVELAPVSPDRRERPWQLTDLEQRWSSTEPSPTADQLERVFIRREADRLLTWVAAGPADTEAWRDASFLGGASVPLTAPELLGLRNQLRAAIEPFIERASNRGALPADARYVRIVLAGTPLPPSMAPDPTTATSEGDRP